MSTDKTFTISGVFDEQNQYTINKIMIGNKEIDNLNITESTDLSSVKTQIAELLKPSTGGRRKTSKRKYKNNKRK